MIPMTMPAIAPGAMPPDLDPDAEVFDPPVVVLLVVVGAGTFILELVARLKRVSQKQNDHLRGWTHLRATGASMAP